MTTRTLKNISISQYESFLELAGCKYLRTKGGHLIYSRSDCWRPIVFQSHIDPVPERVISSNNKTLGYSKQDFFEILFGEKDVIRTDNIFTLTERKQK
ncbi:type II toxin-antitoxin system HicA family toxin [bacterium]|nr:MAG: type II toxin-antitoxin system HicA family toxin [bacterium]